MPLFRKKSTAFSATLALLCFAAGGTAAPAADDGPEKTPHRLPRVDGGFKTDACLDESFWENALKLDLKYEVRPAENTPAQVKTEVYLAYNDTHLLAAFRAYDPDPSQIKAFITDRDQLFDDDWVGLVFDSFDDRRRQFDFFINPLGVQGDIIETAGSGSNDSWDAIWDSAGKITDYGYCVEIAIPFSSMRFQRSDGEQVWNFDAVRSYKRSVDHRFTLFPRDRNNNCYLCQAERLVGFEGATPGRNIELDPTFSSLYSQARPEYTEGDFEESAKQNEFGLSARWGITPNIQLNATA
ncbi:MAG: carbohydrate binding family 9 domain-containing protein, partial [Candidatus Krumholzibacteria bacterium]|nr:carbohydrate binding family 9 domain-containing protein [Candidatus Krumholzibacteria bacterium]